MEQAFFQCIIMCSSKWVHEGGKVSCNTNYGLYGRWKDFFNIDIHEYKTLEPPLWTFGFGVLYLYSWYFFLWWCMPSQHGLREKLDHWFNGNSITYNLLCIMYMHDLFFESIMVVIIIYVGNLVVTIHDNYFQWHPICPF